MSTRPASPTQDPLTERAQHAAFVVAASAIAAVIVFVFIYVLTQHLFVFTEARQYINLSWPIPIDRFFLSPYLEYGGGRLTGMAQFQLTGALCGTNVNCVQQFGAGLFAIAAVVLVGHTYQITRGRLATLTVAALWILSPTVLGVAMWQAARFDLVAFSLVLLAGAFWWHVFGLERTTPLAMIVIGVASILLLAVAFNAKEVTYYLLGTILLLAIGRAPNRAAVRRNLVACVVPVTYGVLFVVWALTHTMPAYAATQGTASMVDKLVHLTTAAAGLGGNYMFLWQRGRAFEILHFAAWATYIVLIVVLIVLVAMVIWRRHMATATPETTSDGPINDATPVGEDSGTIRIWIQRSMPWGYLLWTMLVIMLISSRSQGASAYYMTVPWWAAVTIGVLGIQRLASWLPRSRLVLGGLVVLFLVPMTLGYLSLFTPLSTYGRLAEDSRRIEVVGAQLREVLGERDVRNVTWRTLGLPYTAFFVTRGDAVTYEVASDIWPWLMRDPRARPKVTSIRAGSLEELRSGIAEYAEPGEVLVVMSDDYRLLLVADEGVIVYEQGA